MLYRYAGNSDTTQSLNAFADRDQIADWAFNAMAWAVEMGILRGDAEGKLNPDNLATRAEVSAILARFVLAK